ncbi:hypothetical protein KSP40_PGU018369 [Platanthera guangdongensis]|uniref:GBF-interacting protein 1 N-terminal domain-containing protein n=1 Tax=Platanthera guangdongensis TaxID=2320717 RepID=A0ABR2MX48_9ASPA
MSAVSRVSIPNNMKKTIQNIKEITGKHSDDEIYAMLKECSMDPNETVQKLLFQDTFHEVKRKRDKRKEGNKEATDSNWRQGPQGRMGRAARGNYNSRYSSHDFVTGRNMTTGKENQIVQARNKDIASSFTLSDTVYKALSAEKRPAAYTSRSMDKLSNGLIKAEHLSADDPSFSGGLSVEETAAEFKKSGISSVQKSVLASSTGHESSSISTASSGVNTSESEQVPVPSLHVSIPDSMGTATREVGTYLPAGEANADSVNSHDVGGSELSVSNDTFEKNRSFVNGRVHGNSLEIDGTGVPGAFQSAPSTVILGTSGSRPSSTYSNRSQHASGPLKDDHVVHASFDIECKLDLKDRWSVRAGPTMEWKPKSTNVNPSVSSKVCCTPFVDEGEARGAISFFSHTSDSTISDTSTKILNLEDMQISDSQQQVIIPDHLQVPESERTCLSFGSFGSNFGLDMGLKVEPEKTKCPEEPSKLSGELEEIPKKRIHIEIEIFAHSLACILRVYLTIRTSLLEFSGRDETPVAQENIYSEDQQPEMPENHLSSITDISSNIFTDADYDQSKEVATDRSQHSVIHAAPVFSNFGLMPQMVSSPFSNFQGTDIHAREATRLPGFVVSIEFMAVIFLFL